MPSPVGDGVVGSRPLYPRRTFAYAFADGYIDALRWASSGRMRVHDAAQNSTDDEVTYRLIVATKRSLSDLGMAVSTIEPFVASSDDLIRRNAEVVHSAYSKLRAYNERAAELLEQVLAFELNPYAGYDVAAIASETTDVQAAIQDTWRVIAFSAATTSSALVLFTPDGGATGKLRITRSERLRLLKRLEDSFGSEVRRGMQAGMDYDIAAAAGLHEFGPLVFRAERVLPRLGPRASVG